MTFDDDYIQIEIDGVTRRALCKKNNIDWPPPPFLEHDGKTYRRVSFSTILDADRHRMTHVCRGALYRLFPEDQPRA